MIPVATITLRREEGTIAECDAPAVVVHSFQAANVVLQGWAATAPQARAYNKCRFTVTYQDGEEYEGRFDLSSHHRYSADLADHMVNYLAFYAGVRRPTNIEEGAYKRFILSQGDKRDACVRFLGTYELKGS